jgi:sulfur dioxygenase
MYFRLLHDDRSGSVSYLLGDLDAGEAVVIDPRGSDVPLLLAMLAEQRLRLRWVLRTHEHDAQLPPQECLALALLGAPVVTAEAPPDGRLVFGGEHLQALATPGHTAACLSFRWRDRLFCGGLVQGWACPHQPRPALPEALWDSVTGQLLPLPDETLLFHGHAPAGRAVGTVLELRRWHPWFGAASRDEFLTRVAQPAPPLPAAIAA